MNDVGKQVVALGAMVFAVVAAVVLGRMGESAPRGVDEAAWSQQIEAGADHIGADELATEMLAARDDLALVDLRPREEFDRFHLPGAISMTVPQLVGTEGAALLARHPRRVVLYSNGPAHPGQAWVELRRLGHDNVVVLDGGLDAFKAQILTPPSLAADVDEATAKAAAAPFLLRRLFCCGYGGPAPVSTWARDPDELVAPTVVSPAWVAAHGDRIAIVDVRPAAEFAALHPPGAVRLDLAELREKHGDRDLMLRPAAQIAERLGALGLQPTLAVAIVTGDKMQDATLAALALLRVGHRALAIVDGGIGRWAAERRPLVATPTLRPAAHYELLPGADDFTIGIDDLAAAVQRGATKVLDVRPTEFFTGSKSTEARPGHIPGALHRPFQRDLQPADGGAFFRPRAELERDYAALGLGADEALAVHCRTGHTASTTWFVLRYLLGHEHAKWFNGSWTEWAERKDLPAATGGGP